MGTKWDAGEVTILKHFPTVFLVQCDTAWTPPIKWGKKVSSLFPTLTFKIAYCELGMGFYGVWETNYQNRVTKRIRYGFLDTDLIVEPDNNKPDGRLKTFMQKHSLSHMGG